MRGAVNVGIVLALLVTALTPAVAQAQYAGPQLSLVGKQPGAVALTTGADGAVEAAFAVGVRNDSASGGPADVRLLLDDGTELLTDRATTVVVAGRSLQVTLDYAPGSPRSLPARDVTRLRLELTADAAPAAALSGTLVIRLGGAGEVSPAAFPIAASASATAEGAAAIDFSEAHVAPASLAFSTSGCWPSPFDATGDCDPPGEQTVEVTGLAAAAAVRAGTVLASAPMAEADGGARATVELRAQSDIPAGAADATLVVAVGDVERNGDYEAEIPLSAADGAPTLSVKTAARDFFLWPLLVLLLGAGLAYWWVRRRDRGRPRDVVKLALLDVAAQHERDRAKLARKAGDRACPYSLDGVFPESKGGWKRRRGHRSADAVALLDAIDRVRSQEQLDRLLEQVRLYAELVEQWPQACGEARELRAANGRLRDAGPRARAVREATDSVLEGAPRPAEPGAAEKLTRKLAAQHALVERWLAVAQQLDVGERLYAQLEPRTRDEELRDLLGAHRPGRLEEELRAAITTAALDRVEDALREDLRVLHAVALWPPARVPGVTLEAELAADGPRGTTRVTGAPGAEVRGLPVPALVERLLPRFEPGADTPAAGARQIRRRLVALDRMDFVFAAAVTILFYFPTLYSDGFGSGWQYLAAFAAGVGGQLAITWQLLPWYRSTRLPKAA